VKNFLNVTDSFPPINCRVFENYDRLDALAAKRGYNAVECGNDDRIEYRFGTGLQNTTLHSGWIATMSQSDTDAQKMVELLKEKIAECLKRKEAIIIGFCRTGHFSVGYSIYVKKKA